MEGIRKALMQAVDGGYKADVSYLMKLPEYAKCQVWLDPLFWQALGKAERWSDRVPVYSGHRLVDAEWKVMQHRLIYALQEGKSADDFFRELLKPVTSLNE